MKSVSPVRSKVDVFIDNNPNIGKESIIDSYDQESSVANSIDNKSNNSGLDSFQVMSDYKEILNKQKEE